MSVERFDSMGHCLVLAVPSSYFVARCSIELLQNIPGQDQLTLSGLLAFSCHVSGANGSNAGSTDTSKKHRYFGHPKLGLPETRLCGASDSKASPYHSKGNRLLDFCRHC